MELKRTGKNILAFVKKYRYVAIILIVGLILMCIPGKSNPKKEAETDYTLVSEESITLDVSLCQILSKIDGAGDVKVLLTLKSGEQVIYQTDERTSVNDNATSTQVDTVIITDSDRAQNGLIQQINPPQYLGAVIVCQGADSPRIRFAIVDAVSKVTGLGADRICVLKMK